MPSLSHRNFAKFQPSPTARIQGNKLVNHVEHIMAINQCRRVVMNTAWTPSFATKYLPGPTKTTDEIEK
jgi:hypothetical protein